VTGFVSEQEKWDYLVNAVAVLYPSSYEGFGLVAAEAFAAGVPVVSGTGGALREVGGGGAIFVDPTSVGSIVQGLRSACDPAVRARHVANGYKQLEVLRQRSEGYARLVSRLWPVGPDQDHQRAGRISR
jgi:glycosyltransferase involved in cell wall biosynthesis